MCPELEGWAWVPGLFSLAHGSFRLSCRLHQLVQDSPIVLREQTLLFPFTYQKVSLMGLCPLFSFIRACVPSRPPFICQGLSEPLD